LPITSSALRSLPILPRTSCCVSKSDCPARWAGIRASMAPCESQQGSHSLWRWYSKPGSPAFCDRAQICGGAHRHVEWLAKAGAGRPARWHPGSSSTPSTARVDPRGASRSAEVITDHSRGCSPTGSSRYGSQPTISTPDGNLNPARCSAGYPNRYGPGVTST